MKKFVILLILIFLSIPTCFAKENINVAVNIDDHYTTYALLTFNSILKNNKSDSDYTFYVLHDGLSPINKLRIKWFVKKHKQKVEFVYIDIDKIFHNNKNVYSDALTKHITNTEFANLFIPELLPKDVKKCIYLDCDTLVVTDLKELWDVDISQYALAMCQDLYQILNGRITYELDNYYNAGVILMNLDYMREMDVTSDIITYVRYYLLSFIDQDALNIAYRKHIKQLDQKWNYMYTASNNYVWFPRAKKGIIHYDTPSKPWNFVDSQGLFNLVELYYSYWKDSDLKFSYYINYLKNVLNKDYLVNYYGNNFKYYYNNIRKTLTENKHPKVSVIIPVYNGEAYIDNAISNLRNQTFKDFEVILVDDGSTDRTSLILNNKTLGYGNYNVIHHKKNQGASAARNTGLDNAKGDYIIFLDIDDDYDKNLLKKMYKTAIKTNSDITICESNNIYGKNPQYLIDKTSYNWKDIPDYIYQSMRSFNVWDKLYKHSFLTENNLKFPALRLGEDVYFVNRTIILADKITVIPDILIKYKDNPNSLTKHVYKSYEDPIETWLLTKEFLEEKGIYKDVERSFLSALVSHFIWTYYRIDEINQKSLVKKYKQTFKDLGIFDKDFTYYYAIFDYIRLKNIMGMYPPSTTQEVKDHKSKLTK